MGFTEELRKRAVWEKATKLPFYDPVEWRADATNQIIRYSHYGDRQSQWGWEIDHVFPTALGGRDDLDNLRPLHFRANASLGGILGSYLSGRT
jgi:5-methylcytosine-specific restriction endonuclease McrA